MDRLTPPFVIGQTYPNLGFYLWWEGPIDLSAATVEVYTGAYADYSPGNKFSGSLIVASRVEATDAVTRSYITGEYDVLAVDTSEEGLFTVSARVVHTTGEVEFFSDILLVGVESESTP